MAAKRMYVTGATSGIGRATALRFAREGWRVAAFGRRAERLAELAAALGPAAVTRTLDVRDRAAVAACFAEVADAWGPPDVLVNNAGLALGLDPAPEASLDDWDRMVDTNVKGLMYAARAVLPGMVARADGHIVNIGSIAGNGAYPGGNVYGGTKAFVAQFSRNLRCDLHGTGVRVTEVAPGKLASEFSLVRFHGDRAKADAVYAESDFLTPEDVADVVWYVTNLPRHVNVNRVEVVPTGQSEAGTRATRSPAPRALS